MKYFTKLLFTAAVFTHCSLYRDSYTSGSRSVTEADIVVAVPFAQPAFRKRVRNAKEKEYSTARARSAGRIGKSYTCSGEARMGLALNETVSKFFDNLRKLTYLHNWNIRKGVFSRRGHREMSIQNEVNR